MFNIFRIKYKQKNNKMAENNKRLLILGKSGGSSTQVQSDWAETNTESVSYIKNKPTISDAEIVIKQNNVTKGSFTLNQNGPATINLEGGGGTNVYENQILLPLYFENISDNSIDLLLILDISDIGSYYHDNASLEKSYDNINWESVVMPTKQSKTSRITIQPKSRVYFRGINQNGFCYYWGDMFYNHFCFDLDYQSDDNYVYVGGNLLSLIIGNDFLSVPVGDIYLKSYSLSRLFKRGYQSIYDSKLKHFEKMTIGLPFHGNYNLILASHTFDYICNTLNLSDESIYAYNGSAYVKNCAVGVTNVIINNRLKKDNISTTNNVNIGISSLCVNSDYNYLYNKPEMTTQTLTFVDENNVETNVVV